MKSKWALGQVKLKDVSTEGSFLFLTLRVGCLLKRGKKNLSVKNHYQLPLPLSLGKEVGVE